MAVSNEDLAKWAGFTPGPPKGTAVSHVFTGEAWTEVIVPAEPAPKTCKRCGAMLLDGKCPTDPRHGRKPKTTRRPDTPMAGVIGTDAEAIMRASIKPSPPRDLDTPESGRTVTNRKEGKGREVIFATPPTSGKVRRFTPLAGPVSSPVPMTSAQRSLNADASKLAGRVTRRTGKSANVSRANTRVTGLAMRSASCQVCHSAVISGECTLAAWHMKL